MPDGTFSIRLSPESSQLALAFMPLHGVLLPADRGPGGESGLILAVVVVQRLVRRRMSTLCRNCDRLPDRS